jgi:hypothetical protein
MWKEIAEDYNEQFSSIYREPKVLKQKYHNALNPKLRRDQLSEEEIPFLIHMMIENNNNWRVIGKLMGRTEASVKNFAYKNLSGYVYKKLSLHDFSFIMDDAQNASKQ